MVLIRRTVWGLAMTEKEGKKGGKKGSGNSIDLVPSPCQGCCSCIPWGCQGQQVPEWHWGSLVEALPSIPYENSHDSFPLAEKEESRGNQNLRRTLLGPAGSCDGTSNV